jgi:hypothetical protein
MPAPRTEYLLDRIRRVLSERLGPVADSVGRRLDSQLPAPRGPSNNCHVPLLDFFPISFLPLPAVALVVAFGSAGPRMSLVSATNGESGEQDAPIQSPR